MLDRWLLNDFAPGEGESAGAFHADHATEGWMPIDVPGEVHAALVAAGRIDDPFYDRNEDACRWVEDREWWYRTDLVVGSGEVPPPESGERVVLVFEGLDVFATVWLDGHELGRTENAFREYGYDVTAFLEPGRHVVAVRFEPTLVQIAGEKSLDFPTRALRGEKRNLLRVGQFGYGWDWGPRLPQIGIWRPVRLRRERRAAIRGVRFATASLAPDRGSARVSVRVEVEPLETGFEPEAVVELRKPEGAVAAHGERAGTGELAFEFDLDRPALWWTHDLGRPALYELRVTLRDGDREIDARTERVGVRTVEIDQSPDPDEPGTRFFRFVLNGRPIFARGANWIPADSFPGRVTGRRYEELLGQARDANMTMVRVWGGGVYEADAFFEACDRLGILVWHDFMFANAPYPEGEAFAANVRAELVHQVRRLRNHPSLGLWCGNNEIHWFVDQIEQSARRRPALPGELYYDRLMPEIVAAEDGHTPYWKSSPYSEFDGARANDQRQGDTHDWTVWHGVTEKPSVRRLLGRGPTAQEVAFTRYEEDMGRFVSEFGIHAAPVLETLRRVVPADQLYHHSPSLDHHNKDNPKNKVDLLMVSSTGLPGTLEDFVDFSMATQAEGLKLGIEHFRRRSPHCSGALVWQLNDCWPCESWSLLDYYGFEKAGYHYVRRAYAPLLASFRAVPGGFELWLTNDGPAAVEDTAVVRLGQLAGEPVREERVEYAVQPGASRPIWHAEAARLGLPATERDRYLAVRSEGERFPSNRHFFVPLRQLTLVRDAAPQVHVAAASGGLSVELAAPAYLCLVHLFVPDEQARYGDNYFDLEPGERRTIAVTSPRPLDPAALEVGWRTSWGSGTAIRERHGR